MDFSENMLFQDGLNLATTENINMILSSQDIQKQVADLYNNRYIFTKYSLNDNVRERAG